MWTFDSSTACIFGENSKNANNCALITFNTKREETVVAEVDSRWACAFGCINGEYVFFNGPGCIMEAKLTRLVMLKTQLYNFFKIRCTSLEVTTTSDMTPNLLMMSSPSA